MVHDNFATACYLGQFGILVGTLLLTVLILKWVTGQKPATNRHYLVGTVAVLALLGCAVWGFITVQEIVANTTHVTVVDVTSTGVKVHP